MTASTLLGLLIAVSVMLPQGESKTEEEVMAMQELVTTLMNSNTELSLPPSPDGSGGPVEVKIGFILTSVSELNENGYVELVGELPLQWTDTRLSFDPTDYANIATAYLPYDKIWTPDIELYRAVTPGLTVFNQGLPYVLVDPSGTVNMMNIISTRSSCDVLGQLSVGDGVVNCTLTFGSWIYGTDNFDLQLNSDVVVLDDFQDVGKWTAVPTGAKEIDRIYFCCPETFGTVDFHFSFRKRTV